MDYAKIKRMKKIIAILIVVAAVVLLFYATRDKSPAEEAGTPAYREEGSSRSNPSNATFVFNDGPTTLSAGRNEKAVAPGSALVEETILLDKFAYGDINADGKEDTALFLARFGAGSGTFIYTAAFVSGPITYKGSKAFFLGDRIIPRSISISDGVVTVEYLDREPDEALAAEPTVPVSRRFVYKAGEFQER